MRAFLPFSFVLFFYTIFGQIDPNSIKYVLEPEYPRFSYLKVECLKNVCDSVNYKEVYDNQGFSIYEMIYVKDTANKEYHLHAFADNSKIYVKELVDSSLVNEGYLWIDSSSYGVYTDEFTYEYQGMYSYSYFKHGQWNYSFENYRLIGEYIKGKKEADWIKYPTEHYVPIEVLTYKSDSVVKIDALEKEISIKNLDGNWYYSNSRYERDSSGTPIRKYITMSRENKRLRRNNTLRWLTFKSDSLEYQNFVSCGTGYSGNRSSGEFKYELISVSNGKFEVIVNQESFYKVEVLTRDYLVVSYDIDW